MLDATPQNSQLHLLLGSILQQQNKLNEARSSFVQALKLNPASTPALTQLVELDLAEHQYDAALERVHAQLQNTPRSAPIQFLEANIFAAQNDWDGTEAAVAKTLSLDPNFSGAYELLINSYIESNRLDQAIAQLNALLARNPNDSRTQMTLGLVYDTKKESSKARDAYEKVISLAPDFVPALNNLACLYAEDRSHLEKAAELARRRARSNPTMQAWQTPWAGFSTSAASTRRPRHSLRKVQGNALQRRRPNITSAWPAT
jgi:tetratricopeptide (TPR) repeat protein